jgi:hypothetical protein
LDAPLQVKSKQAASSRRDESVELAIRDIRDPDWRLSISRNLDDDAIEG